MVQEEREWACGRKSEAGPKPGREEVVGGDGIRAARNTDFV